MALYGMLSDSHPLSGWLLIVHPRLISRTHVSLGRLLGIVSKKHASAPFVKTAYVLLGSARV